MSTPARLTLVTSLVCSLFFSVLCSGETNTFIVPEDDLPSAIVNGCQVVFTPNGAFAVAKDGRWFCDGGLSYATPGWTEWGTQVRRSHPQDTWHLEGQDARVLVTRGTLFDWRRTERFRFTQRAEIISDGLRFEYDITPLARQAQEFGLTLHFPVRQMANACVVFPPGLQATVLPEEFGTGALRQATATVAEVYGAGEARVAVVGPRAMTWQLLDDRAWNECTFRIVGRDPTLAGPLNEGKSVSFSFELLLGDAIAHSIPLGAGRCEIDRYGRLAVWSAAEKLIEGGLVLDGSSPEWLYELAQPSLSRVQETADEALTLSGTVLLGKNWATYDVMAVRDKESVAVTYAVSRLPGSSKPEDIAVAFVFPGSSAGSRIEAQASTSRPPQSMGEDLQGNSPRYVATVAYREGLELKLVSTCPWDSRNMTIDDEPLSVLATRTRHRENGIEEAQIRFSMNKAGAETSVETRK